MVEKIKLLLDSNTIDILTLLVAIATFIVTCLAYRYSRRSSKKYIRNLLARKRATLKGMEDSMSWGGVEVSAAAHLRVEIAALKAEIKELENQL
jgi:hypothetical protein